MSSKESTKQWSNIKEIFDSERLEKIMSKRFKKVILFSMNDEIVHTGYHAMAHYLICVGFFKK